MKIDLDKLFLEPIKHIKPTNNFYYLLEKLLSEQSELFEALLSFNESTDIEFLGFGTTQFVWALNSSRVLKLTRNLYIFNSYQASFKYSETSHDIEPIIETAGTFTIGTEKIYWVIMERLVPVCNTLPEVSNSLNQLINIIICHAEDLYKDAFKGRVTSIIEFDWTEYERTRNLGNQVYFNMLTDPHISQLISQLSWELKLETNWLFRFSTLITHLVFTQRDSDLYAGNVGLRLGGLKGNELIFYDW